MNSYQTMKFKYVNEDNYEYTLEVNSISRVTYGLAMNGPDGNIIRLIMDKEGDYFTVYDSIRKEWFNIKITDWCIEV